MDYEKEYKKLKADIEKAYLFAQTDSTKAVLEHILPELKESEDEKTRKEIVGYLKKNLRLEWATWLEKQGTSYTKRDVDDAFVEGMAFAKDELEKQGEQILANSAKTCKDESAWSEEDEARLQSCLNILQVQAKGFTETINTKWLKSLKQRYTWKPSEEQMRALHDMNLTGNISYVGQGQTLIELYNDLKKL